MRNPRIFAARLGAAVLSFLLAACGGDSSDNDEISAAGDVFAVTETGRLVSFNAATPDTFTASHVITGVNADQIVAIDFRPANETLYALAKAGGTGRLYTFELTTGDATQVATLTDGGAPIVLDGEHFGMDFNGVDDSLRVVSDTGQNLRVDADTGATVEDAALTRTGIAAAAYTNNFAEACGTRLFFVDTSARFARLASSADPEAGVVTHVGSGFIFEAADAMNGFEIVTGRDGRNLGLAALNVVGGQTVLFTIDLSTGAERMVGPVGTGSIAVRGISARPPPVAPAQLGDLFALTESNRLISFNRTSPGKLCTNRAITGLAGPGQVVGIDFRPSTGDLYALSREGGGVANLYTINPVTAVATLASTLEAAASDGSAPFAGLEGVNFGIDFDPTGVVPLRILSDSGQNLRVTNPQTGSTVSDDDLVVPPRATAAAYTNSIGGAGSTRLFAIDDVTDQLYRQDASGASFTLVGGLGADITGVNGFDIDARNGGGLVASHGAADASSRLSSIDLDSGALTAIGTIGGGERVHGLAMRPPRVTVFGLTTGDRLVRFPPHAPGNVTDIGRVEPFTASEQLKGFDFRPADGRLYVTTGILYIVDPADGELAFVGEMSAPQPPRSDCAAGFTELADVFIGFDFDPVDDRLRVVGAATRQNLRVNPEVDFLTRPFAETCLDTPLNPDAPRVIALAHSANFAGASATTLFGIDVGGATPTLVRQGNPSPDDGVISPVGSGLGIGSVADDAGFDIAGLNDEIVLAALEVGGSSNLYRIDLATGTATQIGTTPIGGATPLTLKGLAIRVE